MSHGIRFRLNDSLFVKDPQDTEYGRKLLHHSVILMDELGFESFTFKKLAARIKSTETSIYRYFENKHLLLLFLSSWYWEWVAYLIDVNTRNVDDPKKRLNITVHNIVSATKESPLTPYINEEVLHRIIIHEGAKAYHTHKVDDENKSGLFRSYKSLVEKVAVMILEVNPKFPYAQSVASNLFEMANNQIYFAEHLPKLTDIKLKKTCEKQLETMLNYLLLKVID